MIATIKKTHKQRLRLTTRDIHHLSWAWYKWGDLVDGTTREYSACYSKWIEKFKQCALDIKAVYAKYDMKPPTSIRQMVTPKVRSIYLEQCEYKVEDGLYTISEHDQVALLELAVSLEAYEGFNKKKPNGHWYYEI